MVHCPDLLGWGPTTIATQASVLIYECQGKKKGEVSKQATHVILYVHHGSVNAPVLLCTSEIGPVAIWEDQLMVLGYFPYLALSCTLDGQWNIAKYQAGYPHSLHDTICYSLSLFRVQGEKKKKLFRPWKLGSSVDMRYMKLWGDVVCDEWCACGVCGGWCVWCVVYVRDTYQ